MTVSGSWASYIGSGAIILTIVLGVITITLAILGTRMHRSVGVARPGKAVIFFLCGLWVL